MVMAYHSKSWSQTDWEGGGRMEQREREGDRDREHYKVEDVVFLW